MKESEGRAMTKDIEWLKEEVGDLQITDTVFISDGLSYVDSAVSVSSVYDLIYQLDEPEALPVIPKYVANWIEENRERYKNNFFSIGYDLYSNAIHPPIDDWLIGNQEKFVRAWFDAYKIEEEPLYYALIKGHELMVDEGYSTRKFWNLSIYNGSVFPSNRLPLYGSYLTEMSKAEWNKLGINDSNADFVEVDEESN